ncbi:PAS domain S-box protein [Pedobacter sp. P351]|uniref:PAS domain S-box protein n=1 Tax=Pedobacter superstes TaxID=3133441 RepID=UPI00309DFA4E
MNQELKRLDALKKYQILDTESEHQYDSIMRLASHICKTPVALISFIDDKRQWMKSIMGIDVKEAPLDIAICKTTIQNDFLLEVPDTQKDQRFANYPHVAGPDGVRFYAGHPLTTTDGINIGTICVLDYQPRALEQYQKDALKILANEVMAHLELAEKNRELEKLLQQATSFQNLFNNSTEIHCIINSDGVIEFINDSIYSLLGYTVKEAMSKNIWDFTLPGERERVMPAVYEEIARGKTAFRLETRVITKAGQVKWFEWSDVINDDKWLVNGRDITERKESEEKLKTLSVAVEKSAAGVIIRNSRSEIEWLNAAAENIIGYKLTELKGRTFGDLLVGEKTDRTLLAKAKQLLAQIKPYETEALLYKKDRTPIWIFSSNNPLTNEAGKVEKQVSVIVDITARKHAEEQLIKTREDAIGLSKAKENFLSVISHEMRTPLNAVIGMTSILIDEEPLERQLNNLNILKFSAQKLLTLINDVLDFTKIETGNLQLESVPVDLRELASKTIESLKFKTEGKSVVVNFEVDDNLPKEVLGDSTRLYQIFMNLLGNAVKFTEKGEVKLKVIKKEETDTDVNVKFEVSDTGIGIPADKLDSIFEAYTQAEMDTSRKYGGTGLGLAITQKLILLNQSSIGVKSELGKGTTFDFSITFPKVLTSATKILYPEQQAPLFKHLLVVDDNAINRLLARKVLDKWSVKVDFAENGLEAIEKVKAGSYDMVLMDIYMPVMGGFEAVRLIRALSGKKYQELPIIALTGSVGEGSKEMFVKKGMNDFILKPFEPSHLYKKITKNLVAELI